MCKTVVPRESAAIGSFTPSFLANNVCFLHHCSYIKTFVDVPCRVKMCNCDNSPVSRFQSAQTYFPGTSFTLSIRGCPVKVLPYFELFLYFHKTMHNTQQQKQRYPPHAALCTAHGLGLETRLLALQDCPRCMDVYKPEAHFAARGLTVADVAALPSLVQMKRNKAGASRKRACGGLLTLFCLATNLVSPGTLPVHMFPNLFYSSSFYRKSKSSLIELRVAIS